MSKVKTRIVHLEGGQKRQGAENTKTRVVVYDAPSSSEIFRKLFIQHYRVIRRKCVGFTQPGVAVVAIDLYSSKLVGSLCIASKVGVANSAIIGRHSMTDLFLDADQSLSLRHLAVLVSPLSPDRTSDVRFRIVDLRTSTAFHDEFGNRFEALVAEGPVFIRCGSYLLYFIVTGDYLPWPESPEDGWACIPERVYIEESEAEPDRWQRRKLDRPERLRTPSGPADMRNTITHVQSVAGPVRARARLLVAGEDPVGTLRISADAGVQTLLLGLRAMHQGILLGRYDRCDVDGSRLLVSDSISRVHLLVIAIDDVLYAVDTASTHGTWVEGEEREIRIVPLDPHVKLSMGGSLASLRWIPGGQVE